ncbi:hypothetical protein P171DRAFT_218338 [Karstenula rhodostoma CBS 690.94]|uniref:Uncharacterized protein n=1 Tax=Karstenula rhodostoma CBS 690.94 TaxID=1392251 RepID=A0A9P4UGN1_9PLEO|nr:hypothetical protein P171DRAFT_218338 [Karstenula rhodostoma CBS 690.94]
MSSLDTWCSWRSSRLACWQRDKCFLKATTLRLYSFPQVHCQCFECVEAPLSVRAFRSCLSCPSILPEQNEPVAYGSTSLGYRVAVAVGGVVSSLLAHFVPRSRDYTRGFVVVPVAADEDKVLHKVRLPINIEVREPWVIENTAPTSELAL